MKDLYTRARELYDAEQTGLVSMEFEHLPLVVRQNYYSRIETELARERELDQFFDQFTVGTG